jgi:hypothetical protein
MEEKQFINISNRDIYDKICSIEVGLATFKLENNKAHSDIINRQDITNGKVKLSKWISTTALSLALITIGYLFNYITKG